MPKRGPFPFRRCPHARPRSKPAHPEDIDTLRLFPTPAQLGKLQPEDIIKGWKSVMKRRSGSRKAQALITLANRSIGSRQVTHTYKLLLKQLLVEYDLATEQLQEVEKKIVAVLQCIPFAKTMLAIKGISAISLAVLLARLGI